MPDFNTVEDTLFVPMLGRLYASEKFPHILYDEKALSIKAKLPENIKGQDTQSQYTLMASAVRSTNMDRYINKFLKTNPDGVICMLGAGLETTFYRNDNGKNTWFEIDLPDVIKYRDELLGKNERDISLAEDAFSENWIKKVREQFPAQPVLVTASGLFYYFHTDKVLSLFRILKNYGNIQIVFDTVNAKGMSQMSKYMKQVGHEDANMYFFVDSALQLKKDIDATSVTEEAYYSHIKRKGFRFITKMSMLFSDKFMMVKMVHVKLN